MENVIIALTFKRVHLHHYLLRNGFGAFVPSVAFESSMPILDAHLQAA
jgi:hypothetical protein